MTFKRPSAPKQPKPTFGQRNRYDLPRECADDFSRDFSKDMSPAQSLYSVYPSNEIGDAGSTRRTGLWFGSALILVSAMTFATAQSQSASPFARKNTKQAWETYTAPNAETAPKAPSSPAPYTNDSKITYQGGQSLSSSSSTTFEPYANQPVEMPVQDSEGRYISPSNLSQSSLPQSSLPTASSNDPIKIYDVPNQGRNQSSAQGNVQGGIQGNDGGTYYPGRSDYGMSQKAKAAYGSGYSAGQSAPNYQNNPNYGTPNQTSNYGTYGGNQKLGMPATRNGQAQTGPLPYPQGKKRTWKEKLGWDNLATSLSGFLKGGAGGTNRKTPSDEGWSEDFIVDTALRGEVSAFTPNGLEYGLGAEVRAQYDKYRRGFGGRVGDCPPTIAGCPSTQLGTVPTALRGHTSRFYTSGPSDAKEVEYALEGAYFFLRSAYGDVTIGRDDGAAYIFSLGAPTLLAVGASNSSVDYTGLDAVKTVNDASGFSEKIAYVSPRLLGDQIGVGVQLGVSYALNATACGVDYCVRKNGKDKTGALAPDLKNVIEAGIALDRKFNSGVSVEATATYATAKEDSGFAGFDDLQSFGLGLDLGYYDWKLGGSYLNSNNGLSDGDYTAYDVGLTWQPGNFGFTAGYGYAKDKNVNLTSNQGVFGVNYDFGKYRVGTGVQHVSRKVPYNESGTVTRKSEKATSLFIEGSFTF